MLLPLVDDELRNLAFNYMSGQGPGQTLQATALVHDEWSMEPDSELEVG